MTIHEILRSTPDLLPSEKLVLSIVASHAGRKGSCWPAQGTIAREAGLCRKTVWTALRRLESIGLIESEHRKRQDGGETSKAYSLRQVTTPPMCKKYTPPCVTITQAPVKPLHTEKKNKKTKKEETTTAEKLCEKIPVVKGDGQRQNLPEIPGMSESTAEGLAKKHGIARLLEVARLSRDKKNPAGWARSALENGWLSSPPATAVDTKKNEEYRQLMTLWDAMPEADRRRAYLRGGGFGSPEMPNPAWLKKFFHNQAGRQAISNSTYLAKRGRVSFSR